MEIYESTALTYQTVKILKFDAISQINGHMVPEMKIRIFPPFFH
jgi:hypothetical protein